MIYNVKVKETHCNSRIKTLLRLTQTPFFVQSIFTQYFYLHFPSNLIFLSIRCSFPPFSLLIQNTFPNRASR